MTHLGCWSPGMVIADSRGFSNVPNRRKSSHSVNRKKKIQKQLRRKVWARDAVNGTVYCVWCRKRLTFERFTVEHMKAKKDGGTNAMSNLAAACPRCNNEPP